MNYLPKLEELYYTKYIISHVHTKILYLFMYQVCIPVMIPVVHTINRYKLVVVVRSCVLSYCFCLYSIVICKRQSS